MELDEGQRAALVASYVKSGMASDRARLIVDIAAAAAIKGVEATMRHAKLAPDVAAYMATMSLTLQLLAKEAQERFAGLIIATVSTPGGLEGTDIVQMPARSEGAK
jgi:hypothetical protein